MTEPIHVFLVDDHAVVRTGCRQLLESWGGFEVVEAGSGAEALCRVGEVGPALMILDLNLPDMNGLDLIPRLLASNPCLRILVFTMHEDAGHARRAIDAGAHGFVTKSDEAEIIIEAAKRVARGEFYLSQPVAQKLALATVNKAEDPFASLTRREKEALHALGQGKTLAEIAAALEVSYKTAANTCSQIKNKLNVSTMAELVRVAVTASR